MKKFAFYLFSTIIPLTSSVEAGPYNKPIYNEKTKSYFELYNPTVKTPGANKAGYDPRYQFFWDKAQRVAAGKIYKGVRGRLAVVNSPQIHSFLQKHFKLGEPAWIGLRYWCSFNKLQWVTGEIHPLSAFHRWGRVWNVDGPSPTGTKNSGGCEQGRAGRYLPVHYWSTKQGFFWNANGYRKGFSSLFIEYTTGKP